MTARSVFITLLCLSVAPIAAAQTTVPTDQTIGAYDRLPAGEQKIARSLFESQTATASGPAPMSLDQIAAMKGSGSGTGWGNVFKQMQSDGLVQARNLGQVVSGHYTPPAPGETVVTVSAETARQSGAAGAKMRGSEERVVVSTASGRSTAVNDHAKGGAKMQGDGVVSAGASAGGNGNGVQSASGGAAGKTTAGSGKGGQSVGAGVTTASGSGAGAGAGSGAGGKAVGRSK